MPRQQLRKSSSAASQLALAKQAPAHRSTPDSILRALDRYRHLRPPRREIARGAHARSGSNRHSGQLEELDVEGILAFAERILPRAADSVVEAALSRLHSEASDDSHDAGPLPHLAARQQAAWARCTPPRTPARTQRRAQGAAAALAADPERRDRFEREARAIAALNHPEHRHDPLGRGARTASAS